MTDTQTKHDSGRTNRECGGKTGETSVREIPRVVRWKLTSPIQSRNIGVVGSAGTSVSSPQAPLQIVT